jgi:hypothetical protein
VFLAPVDCWRWRSSCPVRNCVNWTTLHLTTDMRKDLWSINNCRNVWSCQQMAVTLHLSLLPFLESVSLSCDGCVTLTQYGGVQAKNVKICHSSKKPSGYHTLQNILSSRWLACLLTYSLTHSMVQNIWKADCHSAYQKISCFLYGTRRFITVFAKALHWTLSK